MFEKYKEVIIPSINFDDQQQYKAIIKAAILPTPDGIPENISMAVKTLMTLWKPSVINFLSKFS